MFADDIKLYNTCSNYNTLVQNLQAIYNWSQAWILPVNVEKCVTIHVSSKNPRLVYLLATRSTEMHNDSGVLITNNFSWLDHVVSVTKRANRKLYILSKVFSKPNHLVFAKLFKTYVRPILEFVNSAWTPVLQKDILLLETVQRKASRIPFDKRRPSY